MWNISLSFIALHSDFCLDVIISQSDYSSTLQNDLLSWSVSSFILRKLQSDLLKRAFDHVTSNPSTFLSSLQRQPRFGRDALHWPGCPSCPAFHLLTWREHPGSSKTWDKRCHPHLLHTHFLPFCTLPPLKPCPPAPGTPRVHVSGCLVHATEMLVSHFSLLHPTGRSLGFREGGIHQSIPRIGPPSRGSVNT